MMSRWPCWGAAVFVLGSRLALRARTPESYDAIGFVRSLDHFDLRVFQPAFPGYPVYVVAGRVVHFFVADPFRSAAMVSALAAAATTYAIYHIAASIAGERAAWCAVCLYTVAALPLSTGGAAMSDGLATALAALAFMCTIAGRRPEVAAALIGLMLGTRLSYWPLAVSWLVILRSRDRERFGRAALVLLLSTAAWAVPLALLISPRELVALGKAHLVGHFAVWGGTVVTQPDLVVRMLAFARGLAFDGLVPSYALLSIATLVIGWSARRPSRATLRLAMLAAGPYALWVLLGQNLVAQPRHMLPLVVAAIIAIGVTLERRVSQVIVVACVLVASAPLAFARCRTAPPAAQAAGWVAETYRGQHVALFGARSLRFFEAGPDLDLRERTWLAEVDVDLERMDRLPSVVLVTSEVERDAPREARVRELARFCRDDRLDREQPCLSLFAYSLPRGPR